MKQSNESVKGKSGLVDHFFTYSDLFWALETIDVNDKREMKLAEKYWERFIKYREVPGSIKRLSYALRNTQTHGHLSTIVGQACRRLIDETGRYLHGSIDNEEDMWEMWGNVQKCSPRREVPPITPDG